MIGRKGPAVLTLGVLAVLGAGGVLTLLWVTRWGPGTEPDSVVYIAAARSLLAGEGLRVPSWQDATLVPMTHFPPLFPALISAIGLLGVEALEAARWLNAAVFGGSVVLVGLVIRACTRRAWLAVLGGFIVLNSVHLIDVHVMAMSEGVFLLLALLGLALLGAYLGGGKPAMLIGSAVAVGLALLSRYVGVALVGAGLLGLFFFGGRRWKRRGIDCFVFGFVSCLGAALWAVRDRLVAGSLANREFAFHPIPAERVRTGALAMSRWYLPQSLPPSVKIAFLAALFAGLLVLTFLPRSRPHDTRRSGPVARQASATAGLLTIFILLYVAMLAVSISFYDAHTPLDNRLLSPVNLSAVALLLLALDKLLHYTRRVRAVGIVLVIALAAFAGMKLRQNIEWNLHGRSDGEGYSSRKWQQSEVVAEVRAMAPERAVYSNWPEPIYLLTGRLTRNIPFKANPYTTAPRPAFASELADMAKRLKDSDGVLVYFDEPGRWYLPTQDELTRRVALRVVCPDDHGVIYAAK